MLISHLLFVEIYSRLTSASIAGLWQGAALSLFAAVLLRLMPRVCASVKGGAKPSQCGGVKVGQ